MYNFPYKASESTIVSVYRHASRVLKYHLKYQKKNTSYMFIVSVIDFRLLLSKYIYFDNEKVVQYACINTTVVYVPYYIIIFE